MQLFDWNIFARCLDVQKPKLETKHKCQPENKKN